MNTESIPGCLSREEAIDKATAIVEAMGNKEPLNGRGYKIDSWKPPTATERTEAILAIATFLIGPDRLPTLVAPEQPHQHRASCHGPIGELQCGYPLVAPDQPTQQDTIFGWRPGQGPPPDYVYHAATNRLAQQRAEGKSAPAEETDLLNQAIDMYRQAHGLPRAGPQLAP